MSEQSSTKQSARFLELDALRGLAALAVLLFHYSWRFYQVTGFKNKLIFTVPKGSLGVHLFFMISGFVIFMTLEKTKRPLDFIVTRFSRLYPAYWACVLLTFSVTSYFELRRRHVDWDAMLVNLTMIQSFFRVRSVDGVYWTLAIELSFYTLMFLLLTCKQLHRIEYYLFGYLALSALYYLAIADWGLPAPDKRIKVFLLLGFGHLFAAGILFYRIKILGHTALRIALLALCVFLSFITLKPGFREPVLAFFVLFYLTIMGRLPFLRLKPFIFLGTISYPLYLIHQNTGYVLLRKLRAWDINANISLFIAVAVAVLAASAVSYGIEQPAMRFVRSRYAAWKAKQAQAVAPVVGEVSPS